MFFAAVGEPSRRSFDDGSRDSSEAYLVEAPPPPRSAAKVAVAASVPAAGAALTSSSTWAGPRQTLLGEHRGSSAAPQPMPPPLQRPAQRQEIGRPLQHTVAASSSMAVGQGMSIDQLGAMIADLRAEMAALRKENEELRGDLRALRRENELLRRSQVVPVPMPPVLPMPPVPPMPQSPTMQDRMQTDVNTSLGQHARDQGLTPPTKRNPGVARALVVDGRHDD